MLGDRDYLRESCSDKQYDPFFWPILGQIEVTNDICMIWRMEVRKGIQIEGWPLDAGGKCHPRQQDKWISRRSPEASPPAAPSLRSSARHVNILTGTFMTMRRVVKETILQYGNLFKFKRSLVPGPHSLIAGPHIEGFWGLWIFWNKKESFKIVLYSLTYQRCIESERRRLELPPSLVKTRFLWVIYSPS